MQDSSHETRPVRVLSTASRICLLLGGAILLFGAYFLIVPLNMPTAQGVFGCGSALYPPSEPFAVGVCQKVAAAQQLKAVLAGALGLMVLVGGYVLFPGTVEERPARLKPELRDPADGL